MCIGVIVTGVGGGAGGIGTYCVGAGGWEGLEDRLETGLGIGIFSFRAGRGWAYRVGGLGVSSEGAGLGLWWDLRRSKGSGCL